MNTSEFQRRKRQLFADRVAGRIGEAAFGRRLRELRHLQGDETLTVGSGTGSSADASTLRSPEIPPEYRGSLRPDERFDEYRLVACVGSGAFGHVWKAYSEFEDRYVALKILPPELSRDQREIRRVRECFQRVHHLHHEHICPVYRLARHAEHGYFLVMQFVEGVGLSTWRDAFGERGAPFARTVELLSMAASALDYAHGQKVVHRDVKPGNLLCARDGGDLHVVDFGLAEQIHSSLSRVSGKGGGTVGTPAFMSPEACSGAPQDGRSDQYSLACVAYYLISGRSPFEGSSWIVINCHREQIPRRVESASDAVNHALLRALAKNPGDRFPSCTAFVEALRAGVKQHDRRVAAAPPRMGPAPARPAASQAWEVSDYPLPESQAVALAFARHSGRLVVAYRDGTLFTRTLREPEWRVWSHDLKYELRGATFTPEGGFLVLADLHGLAVLDASRNTTVTSVKLEHEIPMALRACSSGRLVCCAARFNRHSQPSRFLFVDLISGKIKNVLAARSQDLVSFSLSHDGRWLVESGSSGLLTRSLKRLHLGATPRFELGSHAIGTHVEFSRDDRYLAALLSDGSIRVFDVASGKAIVIELPDQPFRAFTFAAAGNQLIALSTDQFVRCLDVLTGNQDAQRELPGPGGRRVAVSDTGRVAVALKRGGVAVSVRPM